MNKAELKIKTIKIFATAFSAVLLACSQVASASTLPTEMNNINKYIDNVSELINVIRDAAKTSNVITKNTEAASAQGKLETSATKMISDLTNLKSQANDITKFFNLNDSLNTGNFSTVIPQMQEIANTLKNFQNIETPQDFLSAFNSLKGLGISGFDQVSSIMNEGFGKLTSAMNSFGGMGELFGTAGGNLTSLQSAFSNYTTVASGVGTGLGVGGIGNNYYGSVVSAAASNLDNAKNALNTTTTGIADKVNTGASALGQAATAQTVEQTKKITDEANTKDLKQNSVCDGKGEAKGAEGAKGVPVIEQEGALLDLTKQIAKMNIQMRAIDQKTCELTKQIMELTTKLVEKEYKLDPEVRAEAQKTIDTAIDANKKDLNEGRVSSDTVGDNSKKTRFLEPKVFLQEEKNAANSVHLDMLKNSNIQNLSSDQKEELTSVFEQVNEIEKDEKATYIARVSPTVNVESVKSQTPKTTIETVEQIIKLANPKNTLGGQYLTQIAERDRIVSERLENANTELQLSQGIWAAKECVEKTKDGKTCITWSIKVPAKFVGDTGSALALDDYTRAANADEIAKKDDTKAVAELPDKMSGNAEKLGKAAGAAASTASSGSSSGSNALKTLINGLLQKGLEMIGGSSDSESSSDYSDTGTESETTAEETPAITVTFTREETMDNAYGTAQTKLSWTSENADNCAANNDWVTFAGTNGMPTATTKFIKESGEDIGTSGSVTITHPALFSFSAYASRGAGSTNTAEVPVQYSYGTLRSSGGTLSQTYSFSPDLTNLGESDYITVKLNDYILPVMIGDLTNDEDRSESEIMADKILSAMSASNQAAKFGSFTKSSDGGEFTISTSTKNYATYHEYEIDCYNDSGDSEIDSKTITFF